MPSHMISGVVQIGLIGLVRKLARIAKSAAYTPGFSAVGTMTGAAGLRQQSIDADVEFI